MTALYSILTVWLLINIGAAAWMLWIGETRKHTWRGEPPTMRWIAQSIAVREKVK
jgi:hypothetical protein